MNRIFLSLMLFVMACSSSISSNAAVISVQPVVAGYFDTSFTPVPPPWLGVPTGEPVIVQIDVMMEVISLAPGEDGFGSAGFSFNLSSGLADVAGWNLNDTQLDTNGAAPGGLVPIFLPPIIPPPVDLQGILVVSAASSQPGDIRRDLGEAGSPLGTPYSLGSVFLQWEWETFRSTVELEPLVVNARLTNGNLVSAQALSDILVLGFPEPSSVVLLGGMLAMAGLRRRGV
jgi:hypothetical protein